MPAKANGSQTGATRAILLCLLDTEAQAGEILALDLADIDQNGTVSIRHGKGDKGRTVFLGQKSRRALKAYLKARADTYPAIWVTDNGERLKYWLTGGDDPPGKVGRGD
jgi:integrase/recombinase XerD